MENYVFVPTLEQIRSVVKDELKEALQTHRREIEKKDRLMTRQDTADYLGVTLPTIHKYINEGILTAHKIGGRTLFKKNEVDNALFQIKKR